MWAHPHMPPNPVFLSATDTPPTCTKTSYIPELVEGDCVATLPEDLGFCYGKCGQNPAWCCRPEGTENVNLNITFECEDGSSRTESVSTSHSWPNHVNLSLAVVAHSCPASIGKMHRLISLLTKKKKKNVSYNFRLLLYSFAFWGLFVPFHWNFFGTADQAVFHCQLCRPVLYGCKFSRKHLAPQKCYYYYYMTCLHTYQKK